MTAAFGQDNDDSFQLCLVPREVFFSPRADPTLEGGQALLCATTIQIRYRRAFGGEVKYQAIK